MGVSSTPPEVMTSIDEPPSDEKDIVELFPPGVDGHVAM
jgi:hypothetical protein